MSDKKKRQIVISDEARTKLVEFGKENHIGGGLSGAIEYIAWHLIDKTNSKL